MGDDVVQLAGDPGPLGRGCHLRLRVPLGLEPGGPVLQGGVVAAAVAHRVAEYPDRQFETAEQERPRRSAARPGCTAIGRGPSAEHRDRGRRRQAHEQRHDRGPARSVGGHGVEQDQQRQVGGHGGPVSRPGGRRRLRRARTPRSGRGGGMPPARPRGASAGVPAAPGSADRGRATPGRQRARCRPAAGGGAARRRERTRDQGYVCARTSRRQPAGYRRSALRRTGARDRPSRSETS